MSKQLTTLALMIALIWSTATLSIAYAGPLPQDPRPSDDGDGSSSDDGHHSDDSDSAAERCAILQGEVLHWGVGALGGIGSKLSTGSWEVDATSSSNGTYSFGSLGTGIATLQVVLPPALDDSLDPLIQNAGVYLNCDYATIANIAVYSGPRVDPPATLEMTGPSTLSPGVEIPVKLTVKNTLPNDSTNVIVTSLMPAGLTATKVEAASIAAENLKIVNGGDDGQLVAVFLDTMPSGAERNVFITVKAAADQPNSGQIRQTATLFYRESAADQAWLDFTIGSDNEPAPAAPIVEPISITPTLVIAAQTITATATPEATATPQPTQPPTTEPTVEAESEDEDNFVPPNGLPKTGDTEPESVAEPPPDMLPVTGRIGIVAEVEPFLPLAGVSLTVLILLIYGVRSVHRTDR
ncbi:MAG: DUF11 domain-containing protein [Anaerolineae bacterium]|nr:DUF11 domain-containing protein [Anaerolineae bacterium]